MGNIERTAEHCERWKRRREGREISQMIIKKKKIIVRGEKTGEDREAVKRIGEECL